MLGGAVEGRNACGLPPLPGEEDLEVGREAGL